jgi:ABC-2 type transport system permease protein
MSANLAACRAILERDVRMFMSFRSAFLTQALSLLFTISLFYFLSRLMRVERFGSADQYFAFVAVGLVILSVVYSTMGLAETLRAELIAGTFERLLISPFGPVLATMSMALFPLLRALLMGTWTLLVSAVIFGLDLQWSTAALAIPVALLSAVAFAAIALVMASLVVAFKRAPGIGFVIAGIALVSGLYFPPDLLPGWMRWMSDVQPFTPAVELLRHVLVGLPTVHPAWLNLTKLALWSAVLLPVATWLVHRAVEHGYRRGTLLEY